MMKKLTFSFHVLYPADDPRCVKKTGNNPDPDDCSRFIACANGTLIAVQRCGDGTLYWPQNNTCEFAQSIVHECGSRRIPETIIIRKCSFHGK